MNLWTVLTLLAIAPTIACQSESKPPPPPQSTKGSDARRPDSNKPNRKKPKDENDPRNGGGTATGDDADEAPHKDGLSSQEDDPASATSDDDEQETPAVKPETSPLLGSWRSACTQDPRGSSTLARTYENARGSGVFSGFSDTACKTRVVEYKTSFTYKLGGANQAVPGSLDFDAIPFKREETWFSAAEAQAAQDHYASNINPECARLKFSANVPTDVTECARLLGQIQGQFSVIKIEGESYQAGDCLSAPGLCDSAAKRAKELSPTKFTRSN